MQVLAIGLAASLLFGPAPSGDAAPDDAQPSTSEPLPDVDDPVGEQPEAEPPVEAEPKPEAESPVESPVEPEAESPVEPEPESPVEPEPEAPPPALEQTQAPPTPTPVVRDKLGCAGSKPCRKMSIAGIVVGTLGLAAVGTGIGLVVKPDEVIPESPAFVTSTHPAGTVTLTIGAGVTLTAVLMLIAAHKGYKKRGEQARRIEPIANGLRF